MSSARTERLLNLVICLLSTRQYLTAARLAQLIPGYEHGDDPKSREAFQRMFERDKAELRDLGIPLETGTNSVFDSEADAGYRIARRDYDLPEVALTPEEAAAVALAARLWRSGPAGAASSAVAKLRAAGVEVDERAALGIEPIVHAGDPALAAAMAAVRERRPLRFDYRSVRADAAARPRRVDPWGVVSWRGRWYLVGRDRDRGEPRVFRLSRIVGALSAGPPGTVAIPAGVDLVGLVAGVERDRPQLRAVLRLRSGAAAGLRRQAQELLDGGPVDWDRVAVGYHDEEFFAEALAGYGSAVVVEEPASLRSAVLARLRAIAGGDQVPEQQRPAGVR